MTIKELSVDEIMADKASDAAKMYSEIARETGFHLMATAGLTKDGRIAAAITHIGTPDGRFSFGISSVISRGSDVQADDNPERPKAKGKKG